MVHKYLFAHFHVGLILEQPNWQKCHLVPLQPPIKRRAAGAAERALAMAAGLIAAQGFGPVDLGILDPDADVRAAARPRLALLAVTGLQSRADLRRGYLHSPAETCDLNGFFFAHAPSSPENIAMVSARLSRL